MADLLSYEPDPQVLLGPLQLLELIFHNAPQLDPEASLTESILDRSGPQSDRKSDSRTSTGIQTVFSTNSQKQSPQKKNGPTARWSDDIPLNAHMTDVMSTHPWKTLLFFF